MAAWTSLVKRVKTLISKFVNFIFHFYSRQLSSLFFSPLSCESAQIFAPKAPEFKFNCSLNQPQLHRVNLHQRPLFSTAIYLSNILGFNRH